MPGYRIIPSLEIHPDDVQILEGAEVFLNNVMKRLPQNVAKALTIRGQLVGIDGKKERIAEIFIQWADGEREISAMLGKIPSLFHQLMDENIKVSGLFGNYLNEARKLELATPNLLTLIEVIDGYLRELHFPEAEIEAGHGYTEIPIALYTNPTYLLSHVSVAEFARGTFGEPPILTIH